MVVTQDILWLTPLSLIFESEYLGKPNKSENALGCDIEA